MLLRVTTALRVVIKISFLAIGKNLLAVVAPGGHMIDGPRILDPQWLCHV